MADTTTALLGLLLQGTGGNNNSWGTNLNAQVIQLLEDAVAGQAVITSAGGTYTLNAAEARASTLVLSNTLTSNLTIVVPDTAKNYRILNYNAGAFFTLLKCATAATTVNVPRKKATDIIVYAGTSTPIRGDLCEVGRYVYDAASVADDAVECNGALYKRATLPDLFVKIGTTYGSTDSTDFRVPNAYDTGRFLRSRTAAVAVGTAQSSQNKAHTHTGSGTTVGASADHTHTGSGTSSGISAGHTHTGSGTTGDDSPDHTHGFTGATANGGTYALNAGAFSGHADLARTTAGANQRHAHTYSFTTSNVSADHTHTYSFTTSGRSADHTHTYSFTTSSDGGTEARPESLVGILCIKY